MTDFMNDPLHDILRDVVEDGVVDADELQAIQDRLLADDSIDQDEAEFLFAISDMVAENGGNDPKFDAFFIEAITCFVLNDPLSPGVLDDDEWFWLKAMIAEDGEIGELEERLLIEVAERATVLPETFHQFVLEFEEKEYEGDIGQGTNLYARLSQNIAKKLDKK